LPALEIKNLPIPLYSHRYQGSQSTNMKTYIPKHSNLKTWPPTSCNTSNASWKLPGWN